MTHERAAILSIGDELAIGQTLDTNSRWLSRELTALGIHIVEHVTVPDDLDAHVRTLRRLSTDVSLLISTGGLGPTDDDLTRDALALLLGEQLEEDAAALAALERMLAERGRTMTPGQRRQALRPRSARCLPNARGTAPGLAATTGACDLYCLPGPPGELHPMFRQYVLPSLRPPQSRVVATRIFPTIGLGEAELAARLGPLMARDRNPLVGTTASGGVVTIRIRYEGERDGAQGALDATEAAVRAAVDPYIFGEGDDTIAAAVACGLRERGQTLAVVESCTGGLLGSMITAVAGCSDVFIGGWITYSNELKQREVDVPAADLERHGAVSERVARAMAVGALHRSPADHALAITGIAGPDGGSADKPVGTVFIARASRRETGEPDVDVRRFLFAGGRDDVRDRSTKMALAMLRLHLLGAPPTPLLWQMELDGSLPGRGS